MKKLPLHIVGLLVAVCTLQIPGSIGAMEEGPKTFPNWQLLGFVTNARLRGILPEGGLRSINMQELRKALAYRYRAVPLLRVDFPENDIYLAPEGPPFRKIFLSDLYIETGQRKVVEEGTNLEDKGTNLEDGEISVWENISARDARQAGVVVPPGLPTLGGEQADALEAAEQEQEEEEEGS